MAKSTRNADEWPAHKGRGPALSDEERAEIFRRVEDKETIAHISRELGRSRQCIHAFLATIRPTGRLAKAYAEAEAYRMAQKVVREADVDQTLEVLDRIDALPKKERGAGGGSQVVVMVGMPGQPALTPPTAGEIVAVQQRRLEEKAGAE